MKKNKSAKSANWKIVLFAAICFATGAIVMSMNCEYNINRFGDMVCHDIYNMSHDFVGYYDNGYDTRSFICLYNPELDSVWESVEE